jgi:hypothetical protein
MASMSPPGVGAEKPVLQRKLRLLERPALWGVLTVIGALAFGGIVVLGLVIAAALDRPEEADLRGYTVSGIILGVIAATLSTIALLYSLRKRAMQEPLRKSGSMMSWLWLHVTFGILALASSMLHAGCGAVSLNASSGKALFFALLVVSVSGIVWRIRYATVPPAAAPKIGNYSQDQSRKRAEEQLTEIEKLAAGKSPIFHQLKEWLLAAPRSPAELQTVPSRLPPEELRDAERLVRLSASRHRALERAKLQEHYVKRLQGLRLLHIPLALGLPVLLVLHVVGALELPAKVFPVGYAPAEALAGFARSEECEQCHRQIYEEWRESMHAHAANSPVMIAQTNQLIRAELGAAASPDPRQICVNCHGPLGAALASQATLPFERALYSDELLNEGIGCNVCHQYTGQSGVGVGGLTSFQSSLEPGGVYYGSYKDAAANAYHRSGTTPLYARPDALCASCHNVLLDTSGDGRIDKGTDLVLQVTSEEHDEYRAEGGGATCVTCHMPVRGKGSDAAESALLILEQDRSAPPRVTHQHTFIGVDYPLDEPADRDPFAPRREALLRSAARLELSPLSVRGGAVSFTVTVTNVGAGHNLPTGFAFARQMWIEVRGADEQNRPLFSSGLLANPTHDLCDAGTMDDPGNPLRRHMVGCDASDPQLVNIQAKLIDKRDILRDAGGSPVLNEKGQQIVIQAADGKETVLQHFKGGVTARKRPASNQKMTPIPPNDSVTFTYRFTMARPSLNPTVTVRLLFRNLPPYFLRALAEGQPADEEPKLTPLLKNLRVAEMAKQTRSGR